MPTSSSIDPRPPAEPVCPICGGVGYVHVDLPVGHPDFGKLQLCACQTQAAAQVVQSRLYRLSNLDAFQNMTFESFKPQGRMGLGDKQRQSLEVALRTAEQYARSLNGWLLLTGTYGCGKTHLAAAVANFVVSVGVQTLFLTVPDLLDWLRNSYGSQDTPFETRFEEIRGVPLLVLDDLGTQNTTPWAQEKLFQIIDHRYLRRLPTVVTTNLNLTDLDDRVRSRLSDPDLVTHVHILAPDYRSPVQETRDPLLAGLSLLADRSFGTWTMRDPERLSPEDQRSLEKAFRAAQQFADSPEGWLVLIGGTASGKTHLAAAVGNYRKLLGEDPIFISVPELLDHLRSTFSPSSPVTFDALFERVKTAPLLILDDMETQSATPWAREKLYQLINYRYMAKLPTIFATHADLKEIDERVRSRMLDGRLCTIYAITAPPFRAAAPAKGRRAAKK